MHEDIWDSILEDDRTVQEYQKELEEKAYNAGILDKTKFVIHNDILYVFFDGECIRAYYNNIEKINY